MLLKVQQRFFKVKQFFDVGLWVDTKEFAKSKKVAFKILRVIFISAKGAISNKNSLRASALTFYSALSIVPVFAVAFGVAQGFGFEDKLEAQIRKSFAGQEEVMAKVIEFSRTSLDNVSGGLVAGISILFLLWSVIKLLNHVENAFNKIWNIRKPRTFLRKFTDYLSLVLFGPIFFVLSSSLTVFISTQVQGMRDDGMFFDWTGSFILTLMQLAPFVLLWILFTLIYLIIPNKNVKFIPALMAGIVAGTAFAFLESGYVYFQVAMSRYNAIYGSFAALPLFLIWLQISWLIILFGAEISHGVENAKRLGYAEETKNLSQRSLRLLCLVILKRISEQFKKGEYATSASLTDSLNLPIMYVEKALDQLSKAQLIAQIQTKSKYASYQPATSIENFKIAEVIKRMDLHGANELRFVKSSDFQELEKKLDAMNETLENSELNQHLL